MANEGLSTFGHAVREANRMGDTGDNGVERVGDRGDERVNGEGDDGKGDVGKGDVDKGNDEKGGGGDDGKGDNDNDESDGIEGDGDPGDVGRGRIRRVLCVEDAVYGRAAGGITGKARACREGDTVFIDEAPGTRDVLPSILTGNSLLALADLWRAPRGWRGKVALSL